MLKRERGARLSGRAAHEDGGKKRKVGREEEEGEEEEEDPVNAPTGAQIEK